MGKIHRLVRVRPGIVGCWEVDSSYMVSGSGGRGLKKLYFCFREDYRVVVLDREPDCVVSVRMSPPRDPCVLPTIGYSPRNLLRDLKLPCQIYYPCACICHHVEDETLPCDSQCNCPEEWQELHCEKVHTLNFMNRLMYSTPHGEVYRYLVTIGDSKAYVAPFPPPRNMSIAFEMLRELSTGLPDDQYDKLMKKYNGYIPDAVNFFNSYLPVDASVIYPNGIPDNVELYMNRYIYVNFFPKYLAFNFYPIGSNKFHAVVIAWLNSDDEAYRAAKVAWEIRKDVTVPILQNLKRVRNGEYLVGLFMPEEDLYTQSE